MLIVTLIFASILQATPLIFGALGGMINERSGVVNIGIEGMMTFGAFVGATTVVLIELYGLNLPGFAILLIGLVAAAIGGSLMALAHAVMTITYKLDQTISGVALNMIALGTALYFAEILFGRPETPNIFAKSITFANGEIYLISIAAAVVVIILFIAFKYTVWGKKIDAVGENPQAADAMGLNVPAIRYGAVLLSGALAGIGGISIVYTITKNFTATTVAGAGFIALAVMLFGNRKPIYIFFAALVFGLFRSAATTFIILVPNLPFDDIYLRILPYVLTIVILVVFAIVTPSNRDPKALGKPYDKELR